MNRFSQNSQAILFMLISMASFSMMTTVIRLLANNMHSTQMVFMRNIFSLLIIIGVVLAMHRKIPSFKTQRLSRHFWRGTIGFCAMSLWFHAITLLPLTLATAISFITPVLSTIIAIIFLGEKAGIRRWSAIIAGFIGVLVVLRPDTGTMDSNVFLVLFSSIFMAIAGTMVKSLTRTESPETIVYYMSLFMTLWSIIPAMFFWQEIQLNSISLIFLVAVFSTVAHLSLTRAFMRADIVVLMPFDFTRLIFTAILAYFMFGEVMDEQTITGAIIIVASAVYIAHREAKLRKNTGISKKI